MKRTIGIIGLGNMGGALYQGFLECLNPSLWNVSGFDRTKKIQDMAGPSQDTEISDGFELAKTADIIITAVKPAQMQKVIEVIKPALNSNKTLVSVAAGISLQWLADKTDNSCKLARCMPTTTALARHGIFAFCFGSNTNQDDTDTIIGLFANLGLCITLPESKFSSFSAFIGAGPAYVFSFMQGLAQAGLTLGFSQAECREMLIELFIGSASLAKMQSKNFAQLRDDVCSPGGLTIAGINVLDRCGLTGIIVEAVEKAETRARTMES